MGDAVNTGLYTPLIINTDGAAADDDHEHQKRLIVSTASHDNSTEQLLLSVKGSDLQDDDERISRWFSWKEARMQLKLAGPLILSNLLSFLLQLVSSIFVGHTTALQLSAASLANSFCVVTGYSVITNLWLFNLCVWSVFLGMSCAMETLCGQAFGAGEYQKLGVYMQRSLLVLNVVSVPIAVLYAFMGQILVALGQEAQLSAKTGEYGVWLIPSVFAYACYGTLSRFLQTQSIVLPLLVSFPIALIVQIPLCWALVFHSSMGFRGAALANSIALWVTVLSLSLYIRFSPRCAPCVAPLTREALRNINKFLKIAIPSALMVCLEWWSYEILVIISGFLSNPDLQTGIIAICVSSESLLYMIPLGLASAASTRVSNELGAMKPKAAVHAVNVARTLAVVEALLVVIFLLAVRNVWGKVYSDDVEVVEAIKSYIPLFAASSAFDALQAVLSGVVRGAGRQEMGAIMNLSSFYVVGLPVGCVLAFLTNLEGKGLWIGLICGTFLQFAIYAIATYMFDWEKEAKKAVDRINSSASTLEPFVVE